MCVCVFMKNWLYINQFHSNKLSVSVIASHKDYLNYQFLFIDKHTTIICSLRAFFCMPVVT